VHKNLQSGKPAGGGVKAIYAGVVGRGERLVFQPIVGEIALFPACHVKQRFMRARRGGEHGLGLAFPNRFEFALQHLIGVQQRQKPLHEPAVRATPHGLIPADKEKRSGTIHHHDSPGLLDPPFGRRTEILPHFHWHESVVQPDHLEVVSGQRPHTRDDVDGLESRHGLYRLCEQRNGA